MTQIGRSPLVQPTGERGHYALDLDTPRRLRERLNGLHHELLALHGGQQTISEIATITARRGELTREVVTVERQLEETLTSLGFDPDVD